MATLGVVALSIVLIGTASAAKPPLLLQRTVRRASRRTSGGDNVTAFQYNAASTLRAVRARGRTIRLVKYCVYANQTPTALDATAVGADGSAWTQSKLAKPLVLAARRGEDEPHARRDEAAGWDRDFGTQPTTNDIVLHISDGGQCFNIYGVVTPTCFVLPGVKPPRPICDTGAGNADADYNAMPFGVVDCSVPSLGFQATQTNEFGDEVQLAGGGGTVASMTVDFQSFACETGAWEQNSCQTTPGTGFQTPASAPDPGWDQGEHLRRKRPGPTPWSVS